MRKGDSMEEHAGTCIGGMWKWYKSLQPLFQWAELIWGTFHWKQTQKYGPVHCPEENGNYSVINWPISSSAHLFGIECIFSQDIKHTHLLWKIIFQIPRWLMHWDWGPISPNRCAILSFRPGGVSLWSCTL